MVWRTLKRFSGGRTYGRVVDVGGGEGFFASLWEGAAKIIVVDVLPGALRVARERGLSAVAGDVRRLPLRDASCELTLCSDVLEHLDAADVPRTLAELARVSAPGGVTLLHTSCYGLYLRRWLKPGTEGGTLDADDEKDGHRNRLRRRHLDGLIAAAGFRVRRRVYYKHLFHPLAAAATGLLRPTAATGAGAAKTAKRDMLAHPLGRALNNVRIATAALDPLLLGWIPGGAVIYKLEKWEKT